MYKKYCNKNIIQCGFPLLLLLATGLSGHTHEVIHRQEFLNSKPNGKATIHLEQKNKPGNNIQTSIHNDKTGEILTAIPNIPDKGIQYMEKAIQASGGYNAIKKVKNMSVFIDLIQVTSMGEVTINVEGIVVYPDKMFFKMIAPGGVAYLALNGDQGWVKMAQGTAPMPEMQKKEFKESLFRDPFFFFTNYKKLKIQYLGEKVVQKRKTINLKVSDAENSFYLLLDQGTYLPVAYLYSGMTLQGPAEKMDLLSDYRKVNNIMIPFNTVTFDNGQKESENKVREMKFNISIDPDIFEQ